MTWYLRHPCSLSPTTLLTLITIFVNGQQGSIQSNISSSPLRNPASSGPQHQHIAIPAPQNGPRISILSSRLASSVLGLAPRGAPGPILQGRISVFNVATWLRLSSKD
ncbi:hypothetical protein BJX65DRAFT_260496 [Aspergillus insuetus]